MKNDKCCGTCRHHVPDGNFPDDWLCVNDKSEHIADYTEYEETCDFWEEREKISTTGGWIPLPEPYKAESEVEE